LSEADGGPSSELLIPRISGATVRRNRTAENDDFTRSFDFDALYAHAAFSAPRTARVRSDWRTVACRITWPAHFQEALQRHALLRGLLEQQGPL
jgi:hypothetical protein